MPLCVVFDLDDTLYLERDYVSSGFTAVGRFVDERFSTRGFAERAWAWFEQGRRGDIFNCACRDLGLDATPNLIVELVRVYRTHRPSISLPPDSLSCLEQLLGRVRLAMITDGNSTSQELKLAALGIMECFDPLVITDRWGNDCHKPSPTAFRYVEQCVGRAGTDFVYLGDNPAKDFQAPQQLGWRSVRVRRPGGLHVDEPSATGCQPEIEITGLGSLCPILQPAADPNKEN